MLEFDDGFGNLVPFCGFIGNGTFSEFYRGISTTPVFRFEWWDFLWMDVDLISWMFETYPNLGQ